jgi:hypothetical protein
MECSVNGKNVDYIDVLLWECEKISLLVKKKNSVEENRNMTLTRLSTSEFATPSSTIESLSPAFDEIDRVSFIYQ